MAEVALFHHAFGLTDGLRALAERLEAAGHIVHAPDMYGGHVFTRLDDGLRHAGTIGHDAIEDLARRLARQHPTITVTIGCSLGAFPAQLLAQQRRHIRGCVLVGGCLAPRELSSDWRHDVALAIHVAEPDDWLTDSDISPLLARAPHAQVHRYQGKRHLFIDPSTGDYDADAADLFEDRLLQWLAEVDPTGADTSSR